MAKTQYVDPTIPEEALSIVQGARQQSYDRAERNFERIAKVWEGLTDRSFTPHEVALMFVGLKIVREAFSHQRDNLVDGIGYLLLADAVLPDDVVRAEEQPAQNSLVLEVPKRVLPAGVEERSSTHLVCTDSQCMFYEWMVLHDHTHQYEPRSAEPSRIKVERQSDSCHCCTPIGNLTESDHAVAPAEVQARWAGSLGHATAQIASDVFGDAHDVAE